MLHFCVVFSSNHLLVIVMLEKILTCIENLSWFWQEQTMSFVLVGLSSLSKCQVLEMSSLELYKDKHGKHWVYFCTELYFVLTFIPLFCSSTAAGQLFAMWMFLKCLPFDPWMKVRLAILILGWTIPSHFSVLGKHEMLIIKIKAN